VVCFDTAFHADMPALAQHLPLPHALWDAGIRRYGFHGLSYEYVVHELGAASRGRLVIAHLGSGASMAAVRDGRAVETTMGLTPTGGLMMGTRPGDLDPGVLLHLLATRQYGVGEHAAAIRQEICQGLEHLGVVLDTDANTAHAPIVSRRGVACVVRVVRTNEDLMVARHTRAVLQGRAGTNDRRQQCKSA